MDKDNKDFEYKDDKNNRWSWGKNYTTLKVKKISDGVNTEGGTLDSVLINCEKLNCEGKKFRIYQEKDKTMMIHINLKIAILLSKNYIMAKIWGN